MLSKVDKNETLYRAIKRSKPDWLDTNGRPTSAMYKDKGGNSVDRGDNRKIDEVISFMECNTFRGRLKGVVSLNAGECMSGPFPSDIVPAPTDNDPYHANIYLCEDDPFKYAMQALKLADISRVVYINPDMQWVNIS